MYKCPICKNILENREWFPFCSRHCKNVDLYNWLCEEYIISEPLPKSSEEPDKPEDFWKN